MCYPKNPKELVGRKVYFNLSAKKLAASTIIRLTPRKYYEIVRVADSGMHYILDDSGREITCYINNKTAHLDFLAKWTLVRNTQLAKKLKKQVAFKAATEHRAARMRSLTNG